MLVWMLAHAASATVMPAGSLQAEVDGHPIALPALKTDVVAHIDGDLATVTLTQTFSNATGSPLHARYLFPLPEDAAVTAMTLTTPSGKVQAEIHGRGEAAQIFEEAKASGKGAALLDQERPNVFQQQIANLAPGEQVQVALTYAHAVPRRDGAYRWQLPLVVGPRYVPPDGASGNGPMGVWTVKSTDQLPNPDHIDPERVAVTVYLDGGVPVQDLASPSHALSVTGTGEHRTIQLAKGRVLDNQDLRIDYRLAGPDAAVGATAWAAAGHGVVSLLVEPPAVAQADRLTPREMVFVVDTSGSMSGVPLDACKHFMRQAIHDLRPGDMLRLISFADAAREWTSQGHSVNLETRQSALSWVEGLRGRGGTNTSAGVKAALGPAAADGRMRIVVFLTDGYIGNEAQVLGQLRQLRGDSRLFAFGIGTAVNRYLVEELAREGRGAARIVGGTDPTEATEAAEALAERLAAPYLTDVEIDWGDAPIRLATPAVLPDLFLGEPLRVLAKYDRPGTFDVTVRGRIQGQPASLPLQLVLPAEASEHAALPNLWARSQVEDAMIDLLDPRATSEMRVALQTQVTTLGLEYGLVTQWTSFVAVAAEAPVSTSSSTPMADVATPMPLGVTEAAYGGGAAPEPATWLGGLLLAAMSGLSLRKRRGRRA